MIKKQIGNYYTYKDYLTFSNDFRCEIIDGVIYDMSPTPSSTHQNLLGFFHVEIANYLKGKPCKVFLAPFDVFLLNKNQDINSCDKIVQPDISIICDNNKIEEKGCIGVPDFIIEIISPSNKSHDYITKLNLYNDFSVKEYWIVNPYNKTVLKYFLENDNFSAPITYTFNDKIKVEIFGDLEIDLNYILDNYNI